MVTAIDIGQGYENKSSYSYCTARTNLTRANVANETGVLKEFRTYVYASTGADVYVGTFAVVSTTNTCRDSAQIGSIGTGYQSVTGLCIAVTAGDRLGIHSKAGTFATDYYAASQGQGYAYGTGEFIDPTDSFVQENNDTASYLAIYALGSTVENPTVTTALCSDVELTTCTGNGSITAVGGINPTRRGFCWIEGTSGDPTIADSVAYDDGDFGVADFSKAITGLTGNTDYRVRAYATNYAGTGYGSTVDLNTTPAAGWSNIAEVGGIPSASVSKSQGIDILNVSKCWGIAVS